MHYLKEILLATLTLLTVSCGGGSESKGSSLTGIWRLERNNTLYLLIQNGTSTTINVCNSQDPFTATVSNNHLSINGLDLFTIISDTQLEISNGPLVGVKLNKINSDSSFSSGSLAISSNNITDLSSSINVCAFRETDDIYNIIASPYDGGYLEIEVGVNDMTTGSFSIPSKTSISIESPLLPGELITGESGSVDVLEYSPVKFKANFQFTTIDGNMYTGSVDVDL
jgi:hypothetical protein